MPASITIDLTNTINRVKGLRNIDKTLLLSANKTKLHLIKNWLKGRGGDEVTMKPLSQEYAKKKSLAKRSPIPNLSLSGILQQSLFAVSSGKYESTVSFHNIQRPSGKKNIVSNHDVAIGNQKRRPNMMSLSFRFIRSITNFVLDRIQRGL